MCLSARILLAAILPLLAAARPAAAFQDGPGEAALVTSHRAALTLEPLSRVYGCIDTLTLLFPEGSPDSAFVRLHPAFTPSSFRIDGREVRYRSGRGVLSWERPTGDSTAELVIEFRGRIDFPSEFTRVSDDRAVLRAEEILPWGRGVLRSGRISLSVPDGWSAFAPGGPGRVEGGVWIFSWDIPIGGIGWICAGKYAAPVRGETERPVSLYRLDTADSSSEAPAEAGRSGAIPGLCDSLLAFYGSAFGAYRFPGLSVVEVDDWVAGGSVLAIAAPSFIMVKRHAFETDDPFNSVETILPHEVAHQWWGMTVVPSEGAAALLSEGLCEYSAILYGESAGRAGRRDTLSKSPLLRPLILRVKRGAAVPLDTALDIRAVLTQYLKGAYVHHMLRGTIGDTAFRGLLASYAESFGGRIASIPDFRRLAEEAGGVDLGWFFSQWVAGKGLPSLRVYNARSAGAPGGWRVAGRVRVVGYERYTADVTLELRTTGAARRTRVRVGLDRGGSYRNDVPFEFFSVDEPVGVAADPDGDLLLARRLPEKLSDLRDPGEALMIVGTGGGGKHYRSLARGDSARFRMMGWEVGLLDDTAATLAHLQRDRLILYGGRGENAVAARMRIPFPMAAAGDAIAVGGETVRDSTLALIQAVENPWLDDGLLIGVEAFSRAARPELRPFDYSWVLVRGHEPIHHGTWETSDPGLATRVVPSP